METILLAGLPGSGRTRFKALFESHFEHARYTIHMDCPSQLSESRKSQISTDWRFWCLIDIRTPLINAELEAVLREEVIHAHGIILNFVDETDLDSQMHWQQWLKPLAKDTPVMRLFHQSFPRDWTPEDFGEGVFATPRSICQTPFAKAFRALNDLEEVQIETQRVNLEHLLMVLDAAKSQPNMDVFRVHAKVVTTDYAHPVAIEMTSNRLDTFPCGETLPHLRIVGRGLNVPWWKEMINACQA